MDENDIGKFRLQRVKPGIYLMFGYVQVKLLNKDQVSNFDFVKRCLYLTNLFFIRGIDVVFNFIC